MSEKIKKIAVLIDGENVDPSYADRVFSCAASLGTVAVREIYGSGIALNDWAEPILKHTIRTNFTLRPNKYKNSSDIALVIGAMEIFMGGLSDPEKACDCFVIASSDSDFSPLAVRLRREGIDVVGMGEPGRVNPMWPKACTEFVKLEGSVPAASSSRSRRSESSAAQKKEAAPKKEAAEVPVQPEPKPETPAPKPAETPAPAPVQNPAPQPAEKRPEKEEVKKIAPNHRARMEIIRAFVSEQIAAAGGQIRSSELFKALASLPDYKYDQQRSKRNPLDYLMKQYGSWFVFKPGDKGSFWISAAPEKPAEPEKAPESPAPAEPAVTEPVIPEPVVPVITEEEEPGSEPEEKNVEVLLTEAGIPFKDAVRAAGILTECHNLRDVFNRMRRAFGAADGKRYHAVIKGLCKASAIELSPADPKEKPEIPRDDLPLTKAEILSMMGESDS
ncbi:MAG: NYN domain-containing protein [Clostridia bacterium]|nr:NYN domain-containing protein [Clostridia bacterium]